MAGEVRAPGGTVVRRRRSDAALLVTKTATHVRARLWDGFDEAPSSG